MPSALVFFSSSMKPCQPAGSKSSVVVIVVFVVVVVIVVVVVANYSGNR